MVVWIRTLLLGLPQDLVEKAAHFGLLGIDLESGPGLALRLLGPDRLGHGSVLAAIDQPLLPEPGHEAPQPGPDLLIMSDGRGTREQSTNGARWWSVPPNKRPSTEDGIRGTG